MKNQRILFLCLFALTSFSLAWAQTTPLDVIEQKYDCFKKVTDISTISTSKEYALIISTESGDILQIWNKLIDTKFNYAMLSTKTEAEQLDYVRKSDGHFKFKTKGSHYNLLGVGSQKYYYSNKADIGEYGTLNTNKQWTFKNDDNGVYLVPSQDQSRFLSYIQDLDTDDKIVHRIGTYVTSSKYTPAYLYEYSNSPQPIGTMTIGTPEGYGTHYSGVEYVLPEGLIGYTITGADVAHEDLTLNPAYQAGDIVPAETALLIKGAKGSYPYYAPKTSSTSGSATETASIQPRSYDAARNMLHGFSTAQTTIAPNDGNTSDYYYYKMYYLTPVDGGEKTLGFFFGAEDGGPFEMPAGKAYMTVPKSQAGLIKGFKLPTGTTEVGQITLIDSSTRTDSPIYNLSGVRMPPNQKLPAGVYILGNRKIIIQ